ncbi:hypothetical protein DJ031_09145 [bacterium endosymbiont of Escarpia laminata]|nr:MAG: hypothetical protein DJ031_09145 [bacterium endosymbiont of Escarpia laminata]
MTRTLRLTLLLLLGTLLASPAYCLPSLQLYIDLTPLGTTLRPPAGIYRGPIVISRQITLDGQGVVTIDGGGKGTVLTVKADNTVIRGLHLTNSGESHNALDAGLQLKANKVIFEQNTLDNVLFGINIHQGDGNTIRDNRCQPWRAKRRLVVPGSREAALLTRRALRQRGSKVGIRARRPVIGSWQRSGNELARLSRSASDRDGRGTNRLSKAESILGTGMSQNLSRGRRLTCESPPNLSYPACAARE